MSSASSSSFDHVKDVYLRSLLQESGIKLVDAQRYEFKVCDQVTGRADSKRTVEMMQYVVGGGRIIDLVVSDDGTVAFTVVPKDDGIRPYVVVPQEDGTIQFVNKEGVEVPVPAQMNEEVSRAEDKESVMETILMETLLKMYDITVDPSKALVVDGVTLTWVTLHYAVDSSVKRIALMEGIVCNIRKRATIYGMKVTRGHKVNGFCEMIQINPDPNGDWYQLEYWIKPNDLVRNTVPPDSR